MQQLHMLCGCTQLLQLLPFRSGICCKMNTAFKVYVPSLAICAADSLVQRTATHLLAIVLQQCCAPVTECMTQLCKVNAGHNTPLPLLLARGKPHRPRSPFHARLTCT